MAGNEEVAKNSARSDPPQEIPKEFNLVVVNMDKILFEGKAKSIIVSVPKSNLAILPGHTPLFTKLVAGKLLINTDHGPEEFDIDGGVAKVTQFEVVILIGF